MEPKQMARSISAKFQKILDGLNPGYNLQDEEVKIHAIKCAILATDYLMDELPRHSSIYGKWIVARIELGYLQTEAQEELDEKLK